MPSPRVSGPVHILFAFLGIATAFGMISKTTMQLRVLARQQARERSAAEQSVP